MRENPNSTNPFFANKVGSPDQSARLGFGAKNELGRSPQADANKESARGSGTDKSAVGEEVKPREKPKLQKVSALCSERACNISAHLRALRLTSSFVLFRLSKTLDLFKQENTFPTGLTSTILATISSEKARDWLGLRLGTLERI